MVLFLSEIYLEFKKFNLLKGDLCMKKFNLKFKWELISILILIFLFLCCNGPKDNYTQKNGLVGRVDFTTTDNEVSKSNNLYQNIAFFGKKFQTIKSKFEAYFYPQVTVQKGIPVKWIIQMDQKDLNFCNNIIVISKYGMKQKINIGETVVEFTPTESGIIRYSCWMGMIRSSINVVDDISSVLRNTNNEKNKISENNQESNNDDSFQGGGCIMYGNQNSQQNNNNNRRGGCCGGGGL